MGHGGDDKAVFDGYAVIEGVCLKEWGVFWIHEILLLIYGKRSCVDSTSIASVTAR